MGDASRQAFEEWWATEDNAALRSRKQDAAWAWEAGWNAATERMRRILTEIIEGRQEDK